MRSSAHELPADTDVEAALDLLYGPFYHRILQGHAPLSDRFARTIVDYVVAGVAVRPRADVSHLEPLASERRVAQRS